MAKDCINRSGQCHAERSPVIALWYTLLEPCKFLSRSPLQLRRGRFIGSLSFEASSVNASCSACQTSGGLPGAGSPCGAARLGWPAAGRGGAPPGALAAARRSGLQSAIELPHGGAPAGSRGRCRTSTSPSQKASCVNQQDHVCLQSWAWAKLFYSRGLLRAQPVPGLHHLHMEFLQTYSTVRTTGLGQSLVAGSACCKHDL